MANKKNAAAVAGAGTAVAAAAVSAGLMKDKLAHRAGEQLSKRVHGTRKRLKRQRATVRLARPVLGEDTYRRENGALRDAGRRLSDARDRKVLLDTLGALAGALPDKVTARLRARLETEYHEAAEGLRRDNGHVEAAVSELDSSRATTIPWTENEHRLPDLVPGFERIYRRGRKRARAVAADPSTERLHEWRKRVKDLWYAAEVLEPVAPKRLKKLATRSHDLADLLGDDHDLAVLREYAEAHPDAFESDADRNALLAALEDRRAALQNKALRRGKRLYRRPPKRFLRRLALAK